MKSKSLVKKIKHNLKILLRVQCPSINNVSSEGALPEPGGLKASETTSPLGVLKPKAMKKRQGVEVIKLEK